MKTLLGGLFVLFLIGSYLTYAEIGVIKKGDQENTKTLRDRISGLETKVNDVATSKADTSSFAKNDEVNQLKSKIAELEGKLNDPLRVSAQEDVNKKLADLEARLKKKEDFNACEECRLEKCMNNQKKQLTKKKTPKATRKVEQPKVCPNKDKVIACVQTRITEWKTSCKITTDPDKVKSSFISSEKQVSKNLKKEKETLIVSVEAGKTNVPDLALCLKSKEELAKSCEQQYCAGY